MNQGNLASSLANIIATYELGPEDRSLVVMPLFHVHGLMAGHHCSPLLTHTALQTASLHFSAGVTSFLLALNCRILWL